MDKELGGLQNSYGCNIYILGSVQVIWDILCHSEITWFLTKEARANSRSLLDTTKSDSTQSYLVDDYEEETSISLLYVPRNNVQQAASWLAIICTKHLEGDTNKWTVSSLALLYKILHYAVD
jgi:hypothetical protein